MFTYASKGAYVSQHRITLQGLPWELNPEPCILGNLLPPVDLFVFETGSHVSLGWPQMPYVAEASLEF